MPDDKKPRPPHKDYGLTMPKKITEPSLPSVVIAGTLPDRADPTPPPPPPGTITNEDLAMQTRALDRRVAIVETRTERIPNIEEKVDTLLLLRAKKENEQEILTYDVTRAHMEVATKEKVAEVEVKQQEELAAIKEKADRQAYEIKEKADRKAYERKLMIKAASIAGTIMTALATGITILAHHC